MRAVWSWLCELAELDRDIDADEGAALLTGAGLEVESIEKVGDGFCGVVIAQVAGKRKHPRADRLTLVDVVTRDGGTATEVVCGAPNVPEPGGRVLWAQPGAVLPGDFTITKRAIKGVESAGMLCSQTELGIGDDSDGIIVLQGPDAEATLGASAQDALRLRDVVFDVGIPANRPDALGHLGLARELVALVGGRLLWPAHALDEVSSDVECGSVIELAIDDVKACPRYVARYIDGVTVGPSPMWMQARLRAVGVRPLSNLIDVTNYVMFELGQPLHAFDYDHLRGARIQVRTARAGETMKTLDDVERQLLDTDILICDGERPVALGGVMGGLDSEVSNTTTRVLLEAASFAPRPIRRTSRRLGLISESSYRFERHVDVNGADRASARAARLMAQLGGGEVARGSVDAYAEPAMPRPVTMRASRASQVCGIEFSRDQSAGLLSRLGLDVSSHGEGDRLEVNIPTFRSDLAREIDLIEEVVRMHGFDKVPTTLPPLTVPPTRTPDRHGELARTALVGAGMTEAITFGFTSPDKIAALRLPDADPRARPLPLKNPMTVDQSVMRTSLLPNLLAAIARNRSHGVSDVRLFEVGHVFVRPNTPDAHGLPDEPEHVAGVVCGQRAGWLTGGGDIDVYDATGIVERLLRELLGDGADRARFSAASDVPYLHPGVAATIELASGEQVGHLGEIHPSTSEAFGIDTRVVAFDLDLSQFPPLEARAMRPIPRYPAIVRDLSFFIDEQIPASRVRDTIASTNEPLVESVRVLEEYREASKVPDGHKGMLWSITYRSAEKTLTDAEVDAAHEVIVGRVVSALGAVRR